MLVIIKRQIFDSLDDIQLVWTCIEPTIQQIRGKNFVVKSEVYAHLTTGQRALLMFQMLYGHTSRGIEEFYSHQSYLLSNKGVWEQLKKGMQYFGDSGMLQLLEEMDIVYQCVKTEKLESEHNKLIGTIRQINKTLFDILPTTINLIGNYIRNNPNEFVQFED